MRDGVHDDVIDLLVIGAGPAGMAAALTATRHGLRVRVVDEQHAPGGQIFRQAPREFQAGPPSALASYPFAVPLFEAIAQDTRIDWRFGTTVWGLFRDHDGEPFKIGTASDEEGQVWQARQVLIATGAYDLPVAFPGWTLPGVMAAGGVQTLLKSQFLQPGRRFVLAGATPAAPARRPVAGCRCRYRRGRVCPAPRIPPASVVRLAGRLGQPTPGHAGRDHPSPASACGRAGTWWTDDPPCRGPGST